MNATQTRSLTLSIVVHVLILALLMLLSITSKIPPWEEGLAGGGGGGSFVEFGTVEFAAPDPSVTPPPQQTEPTPITETEEEVMTSEVEETINVPPPVKKPEKKPVVKPTETKKPVATVTKPVELPKIPDKKPDPSALYKPGKKGQGGSLTGTQQGGGTGGEGTGSGGGSGSGTGSGSGGGSGTGSGGGHGDGTGIGFDLTGRSWRVKPKLEDSSQETGKVVIEIIVDKYGNVSSANGPARGSTTSSQVLYQKARLAAMQAKFTPSAKGVEEQRGTITFVFAFE
jgi:outer membrane biosynthesis protein TonB